MRTRALFYVILADLILAGLLVLDLVAHSWTAINGPMLELVRAVVQGAAMMWFARAAEILFFRTPTVRHAEELSSEIDWPSRLVQRFTAVLAVSILLALAPHLFHLSLNRFFVPTTASTVISIDILGFLWLLMLVALGLSFWQLIFVRQSTRNSRRRFTSWAVATGSLSLFSFWTYEHVIAGNAFTNVLYVLLAIAVGIASLLLGYRLSWLPHTTREGKRHLLLFSVLNVVLCLGAFYLFGTGSSLADPLFERYGVYWQFVSLTLFATLGIYFLLVFFSTLFSLSSTELVERKSAEVKSLAKLTRFSSDILSSELLLDLPKLAEQITALACEATDSDCAWLELRSSSANGRRREDEDVIRSYVGIGELAAEKVMLTAEGFPEADRQIGSPRGELETTRKAFVLKRRISVRQYLSPTPEQAVNNQELHSLVAVPLIRNNEVRGGLYVAKRREDAFDTDDMTVLTAFSDVASLALETAKLLQDSIEKQKFDGELRAARVMQKSLLPERFPSVPGFDIHAISIPAYDVGGDYYDFSSMWDGSTMIAIGDVSGKGISAAMYMAETKGVVQALAPVMSSMQELLEATNGALLRNSPAQASLRRSFVTLGLFAFHRTGVKYCRAGHTPLLRVKRSGAYEFVQPKGMAVGLIKQEIFAPVLEELSLQPEPGETFVLFSDGITDARSPEGEELGYKRLAQFVAESRDHSARDLTLRVLQSVAEYTESSNFGDDATLVVIKHIEH